MSIERLPDEVVEDSSDIVEDSPDHAEDSPDHAEDSPDHAEDSPDHAEDSPDHAEDSGDIVPSSDDDVPGAAPRRRSPGRVLNAVSQLVHQYELSQQRPFPTVVAVVGTGSGVGVTTVSRALAETLTHDGGSLVCYLDLSRVRSGASDDGGGSDSVAMPSQASSPGVRSLADRVGLKPRQDEAGFDTYSSDNVARLLGAGARRRQIESMFASLRTIYDHVIIDVPALAKPAHPLLVFSHSDAYLLVARHGVTASAEVEGAVDRLSSVELVGAILNWYHSRTPRSVRRLFAQES